VALLAVTFDPIARCQAAQGGPDCAPATRVGSASRWAHGGGRSNEHAGVSLHHLIIATRDPERSADYFHELLQAEPPLTSGFFRTIVHDDEVVLNFADPGFEFPPQHYAFLVDDARFDRVLSEFERTGTKSGPIPNAHGRARSETSMVSPRAVGRTSSGPGGHS
jgi:hypothetical protein